MSMPRYALATGLFLALLSGCGKSKNPAAGAPVTPESPKAKNTKLDFDLTQLPPHRAKTPIGVLKSCAGSCSAVIVDGKRILTAGHCVYHNKVANTPNPLDPPKCNANEFTFLLPSKSHKAVAEIKVKSLKAGVAYQDDWAVLEMDGTPDLREFEQAKMVAPTKKLTDVVGRELEIVGLDPIDNADGSRTWKAFAKKTKLVGTKEKPLHLIELDVPATFGNSGSPVFDGNEVTAILAGGNGTTSDATWLPSVLPKF